jgi:hypothetical protein
LPVINAVSVSRFLNNLPHLARQKRLSLRARFDSLTTHITTSVEPLIEEATLRYQYREYQLGVTLYNNSYKWGEDGTLPYTLKWYNHHDEKWWGNDFETLDDLRKRRQKRMVELMVDSNRVVWNAVEPYFVALWEGGHHLATSALHEARLAVRPVPMRLEGSIARWSAHGYSLSSAIEELGSLAGEGYTASVYRITELVSTIHHYIASGHLIRQCHRFRAALDLRSCLRTWLNNDKTPNHHKTRTTDEQCATFRYELPLVGSDTPRIIEHLPLYSRSIYHTDTIIVSHDCKVAHSPTPFVGDSGQLHTSCNIGLDDTIDNSSSAIRSTSTSGHGFINEEYIPGFESWFITRHNQGQYDCVERVEARSDPLTHRSRNPKGYLHHCQRK